MNYCFKIRLLLSLVIFVGALRSHANIVGTDIQNFNPTTSGLDFLTVHSSETLQPKLFNVGLFMNYAANTLVYSRATGAIEVGSKPGDRLLGADINLGYGLSENWDMGVNFPAILSQQLNETSEVIRYDSQGFTEMKVNTKYRFYGDASGGIAGIFSVNRGFLANNPYMGEGGGFIYNFELAFDKTFADAFAAGFNVGYRKRNTGAPIASMPFDPMGDQYIYSIAASYLFASIDTKLIAEVFGSQPTKKISPAQDRASTALESLIGIKHDLTPSLALHTGVGSQMQKSIASPDWRVYIGINYVFGPKPEEDKEPVEQVEPPHEEPIPTPAKVSSENVPPVARAVTPKKRQIYRIRADILFDFDSHDIKEGSNKALMNLAQSLQKLGYSSILVEGHTDSVGAEKYNRILSEKRARGVMNYLTQHFDIDAKRIKSVGFGESKPIADNGNYQGRQKNRRVDIIVQR